jgi:polar amino acid transport system substrate-binding protein
MGVPLLQAMPASAATLDRVREAGKLVLGYRAEAQPFSYKDEAGNVTGYSVALCERIAGEVKAQLDVPDLPIEWVPVTVEERYDPIEQGRLDLLCSADIATLERRERVAFSIPIFPSGTAALLRSDSSVQLREVLNGRPPSGPIWRASPARVLENKTFSVVTGTRSEPWLAGRLKEFKLAATVVPVDSYEAGISRVLDRSADVFFGDRAILAEHQAASPSAADLIVLDRLFTREAVALPLARGDEDFRLVVDRALSHAFASDEFREIYGRWFGAPDEGTVTFFRSSALPD